MAVVATVAVIGNRTSVTPFKAFGFSVWAVDSPDEMRAAWADALSAGKAGAEAPAAGLIMLTEPVAEVLQEEVRAVDPLPTPAVLVIPASTGPTGYALERIRRMAEMAVGTDVIGKGESQNG